MYSGSGPLGGLYDSQATNRSARGGGRVLAYSPPCFLLVAWKSYITFSRTASTLGLMFRTPMRKYGREEGSSRKIRKREDGKKNTTDCSNIVIYLCYTLYKYCSFLYFLAMSTNRSKVSATPPKIVHPSRRQDTEQLQRIFEPSHVKVWAGGGRGEEGGEGGACLW